LPEFELDFSVITLYPTLAECLYSRHDKYVVAPAAKSSNNIVFVLINITVGI
jgi:hypothetical protein